MRESNFWQKLRTNLSGRWLAHRVENSAGEGMADVVYTIGSAERSALLGGIYSEEDLPPIRGWIELKVLPEWPKRTSTVVKLEHYTGAQAEFLRTEGEVGGYAWLFLKVEGCHLLFDWMAAQYVGSLTREGLYRICSASWGPRIDYDQLLRELTRRV